MSSRSVAPVVPDLRCLGVAALVLSSCSWIPAGPPGCDAVLDPTCQESGTGGDSSDPLDTNGESGSDDSSDTGPFDLDADGVAAGEDCDDTDNSVGAGRVWYLDADHDGVGDSAVSVTQCEAPSGYAATAGDCDDQNSAAYPGAPAACDEGDNNCDGMPDATAATSVGGNLVADATWTAAGSPYCFASAVTVYPDVTLTIEAGTSVRGGDIQNYGTVVVSGTAAAMVEFEGTHLLTGDSGNTYSVAFAHFNGGSFHPPDGSGGSGGFTLVDSVLEDTPGIYLAADGAFSESLIERNIFLRTGAAGRGSIEANMAGKSLLVANNVFYEQIGAWAIASTSGDITVVHNSFLSTDRIAVASYQGITAESNWWNTTDTAVIDAMIFDYYDTPSATGVINYVPYLEAPDADTPDPSAWIP